MFDATLRDRVKGLLTASGRSDVPPFMVMDVMAAAERIEAAGGHVIHMEVGQPAAPAPRRPSPGGGRPSAPRHPAPRGGGGGPAPPPPRRAVGGGGGLHPP